MNPSSVQCPNCGHQAAGKFCSNCGTAIASACPSCGTQTRPGARGCQACGTSLTPQVAPKRWNAKTVAPWVATGVATITLVVVLASLIGRVHRAALSPAPFATSGAAPGEPVDLSSMTPREAADRLFNRIMAAAERGDTVEALRFVPMALQAYDLLGTLDNDARYHVGLIHATAGNLQNARAYRDRLRQSVPDHLLGIMLEHTIAKQSGDQGSAARAYKAFLAAYDAEMAAGREEYKDHETGIDGFRRAAQASIGRAE